MAALSSPSMVAFSSAIFLNASSQRNQSAKKNITFAKSEIRGQQLSLHLPCLHRQVAAPKHISSANATEVASVEKIKWGTKRSAILANSVRSVNAKEALRLQQEEGYSILDVRPVAEFEEVHPEGAKNASVYRLIKEWTPWDILRRAGFAFFGIFAGTEGNPEFLNEVTAAGLTKDSKIIVACSFGGTLKPTQNFPEGKESRSLIAAYILTKAGFKSVLHIEGGLQSWFSQDFPVTFKDDQ
eukprot:jgi/Mesen1/1434/ME000131S00499